MELELTFMPNNISKEMIVSL